LPHFPRGGFSPLQPGELGSVAARPGVTAMAVVLAWLPQRSPDTPLIAGTSSVVHLRGRVSGAALTLSGDDLSELTSLAGQAGPVRGTRCGPAR